jgi:hypothetical protein
MLTPKEQGKDRFKFIPDYSGGKKYFRLEIESPTYDKFGGLTFYEFCGRLEAEIARTEPLVIFESFKVIPKSRYGIGLDIIVDAERIDRTVIEQAIDHFYEIEEKDWQAIESIPRERLPYESEGEALTRIDYPLVLLGQAIRKGAG